MRLKSICDELLLCFNRSKIVVEKYGGGGRLYYFIDMIWSLLRYGAKSVDYCMFEFYRKSARERNMYLTSLRYSKIYHKLKKSIPEISRDKMFEYKVFNDYIQRAWMVVNKSSNLKEVESFVSNHNGVIAKPIKGEQGRGILKINSANDSAFRILISNIPHETYIIEEVLKNDESIDVINKTSLNTVRCYTFIDRLGNAHILEIMLRAGITGAHVDNWGSGGVGYVFDKVTGICSQYGIDKQMRLYSHHPSTNYQMLGYKLPYFEELKQYVKRLSKVQPKARFVGWDIAITPNGFELIEMNCPGGHDFLQAFGRPWGEFIMNNW